MKLCDRCPVPGCCLDYLGKACEHARKEIDPTLVPTNAECSRPSVMRSWPLSCVSATLTQ